MLTDPNPTRPQISPEISPEIGATIPDNWGMNPLLATLQPYPFERLRQLFAGATPPADRAHISLGIGEPKHATPEFIKKALMASLDTALSGYPATAGELKMREACAQWLKRRYQVDVNAATQVLPVNGSREALFSLAQAVLNPTQLGGIVISPNPFYQIYEGATLLGGAQPYYVANAPENNFSADWDSVPEAIWEKTQLVFVCSPGNPTGKVMPLAEWQKLFALSEKYGFVIASDECYSEIYFREEPPLGGLEAASQLGNKDFKRLISFTSLSKRSNVPGLRSGFVAGDAAIIKDFLLYRTYHGCAMSGVVQAASIAAWNDEAHVVENRNLYRTKFAQVTPVLAEVMDVQLPDASFYLWAGIPAAWSQSDTEFARELYAAENVTVLPGSYIGRTAQGRNPGQGRVRMALVAETEECLEAAHRIARFIKAGRAS
jgi:N-succinyldiaminopimelate aminotransferase